MKVIFVHAHSLLNVGIDVNLILHIDLNSHILRINREKNNGYVFFLITLVLII